MNVDISFPAQLKSNYASTELPNQDDAALRCPVDDVTSPMTSTELHIPRGNDTIKVVVGVYNLPDPTKTPRIYGIPPGYATVSVDQVCKGYDNIALDIPGGDGENTLGEG
jgi:hypothetical protein